MGDTENNTQVMLNNGDSNAQQSEPPLDKIDGGADEQEGEEVKGEVKGEEVIGEEVIRVEVKGEEVKGEEVKGEEVNGEEVKEEEVKGEEVEGEDVKGEEVEGEENSIDKNGEVKQGMTIVEFIELDENGEEVVVKRQVPLVKETRKIVKRQIPKLVMVPIFLDNEEEVEEEAELMEETFFEVVKKTVKVVTKNEAGEDEEKEVEVLEEVMLDGLPKGAQIIRVNIVKDDGEVSEEEVIVRVEEEERKALIKQRRGTRYKKKRWRLIYGEGEGGEEEEEIEDEEGETSEEELIGEETEGEGEEEVIEKRQPLHKEDEKKKKKLKKKKKIVWKKKSVKRVEVPLDGEIDIDALLGPSEGALESEMVEELETEEEEEEEEEEPREEEKELKKIREELLIKLKNLSIESTALNRRNVILCKKVNEHFRSKRGAKNEEESTRAEDIYKKKITEFVEFKNSLINQCYIYMKEVENAENARDDLRSEAIRLSHELEAKERQLATKVGRAAERFLLKQETLDVLISKQFEIDRRASVKRTEFFHYQRRLNDLQLEEKLQVAHASKGINFIDYEEVKTGIKDLQDTLDLKDLIIQQTRRKLTSNAHTLAHVQQKKEAVDRQLNECIHGKEISEKHIMEMRAEVQKLKQKRAKVMAQVSSLETKVGIINYPNLLRDYKYIGQKYQVVSEELDDVKQRYKEKCRQIESVVERLKSRRAPEPPQSAQV